LIDRRSRFEVFLGIVVVMYEFNKLKMDVLIRKANLCNGYQKEFIDLLLVHGLLGLTPDNFLYLTSYGERKVGLIAPGIKKAKRLYAKIKNNED